MSNEIKIEKGVPIPQIVRRIYPPSTFENLQVGDSFYIDNYKEAHRIYLCFRNYCTSDNTTWKISMRRQGSGARIWRIK